MLAVIYSHRDSNNLVYRDCLWSFKLR